MHSQDGSGNSGSGKPNGSDKPRRRVRYKGTHPRRFEEKYKERDPGKYSEDVEKIKARGATPAGTHRPICVDEILEVLNPQPGEVVLDCTLGYGGHSSLLLERVLPNGRLIALDQDPIERPKTEARLRAKGIPENALVVGPVNFREAHQFLREKGIGGVDMILADLGLSSMQIDDPLRGFNLKVDCPLDLRMNPSLGEPAAQFLAKLDADSLTEILTDNSDEPRAAVIARALVKKKPKTTQQLVDAVREVMKGFSPRVQKEEGDAPIRRALQALRIAVNDEYGALDQLLADIPKMLKRGGRVAILSFHSGEDRRVKKAFQAGQRAGIYREIAPEFIRPSLEEQRQNPRSKPAKLRWAKV